MPFEVTFIAALYWTTAIAVVIVLKKLKSDLDKKK